LALELGGRTYYAMKTEERVTGSGSLAEVRFAPCDDGSGIPAGDRSARFDAQRLDGIDPTVAFAVPSQWPRRVFVTGPVDGSSLPAEVERLLNY
jgi:hypothetical protein